MNYEEWEASAPKQIKDDSLWKMKAYRLALFLADLGWDDATLLMKDRRTFSLADQLYRAVGSISANMAEGYSRGTGRDRARFYEYALGSARESRDWYYKVGLPVFGLQANTGARRFPVRPRHSSAVGRRARSTAHVLRFTFYVVLLSLRRLLKQFHRMRQHRQDGLQVLDGALGAAR